MPRRPTTAPTPRWSIPTAAPGPRTPARSVATAVIEAGEVCDDGNGRPGDGCSGVCTVEPNYSCPAAGPALRLAGGLRRRQDLRQRGLRRRQRRRRRRLQRQLPGRGGLRLQRGRQALHRRAHRPLRRRPGEHRRGLRRRQHHRRRRLLAHLLAGGRLDLPHAGQRLHPRRLLRRRPAWTATNSATTATPARATAAPAAA